MGKRHYRNNRSRRRSNNRSRGGNNNGGIAKHHYVNEASYGNSNKKDYQGSKFSEFNLHKDLFNNVNSAGFHHATEVQDKTIPMIMQGQNVLGFSQTGSGKTGAFLIPMINKVLNGNGQEKVMVIAPTRELAMQISREAIRFVKGTRINVSLIIGGESVGRQIGELKKGQEFIIGTPGRLKDMIKRRHINTQNINNIIVDEVDRMMDMGFIKDIEHFFKLTPNDKQSLFFSATHNSNVTKVANRLTESFEMVKIDGNRANDNVMQSIVDYSSSHEKLDILHKLLDSNEVEKAIIFVRTKRYADKVHKTLSKTKHKSSVIHGGKRQNQRKKVYQAFKQSKFDYLVATNVAARGLDVDDVTHVINLDEPDDHDEYIHRIGRTGRNGKTGTAFTFVQR